MNIDIPESLFESLKLILKYQNTLLLKEISKEKGWKYSELKKEFLKDEDMEVLLKKYNKKQNKRTPKVEEPEPVVEEPEPVVEEPEPVVEEPEPVVEEPEQKKKSRKKKIKKTINSKEIKCHKYIFDGEVFYVNVDNQNAYDKNLEFVGVMLGNGINFNADEKDN
jgi:hypothetical protein